MLAGDFNKNIESNAIESFMIMDRLTNLFGYIHEGDAEDRERTHKRGNTYVDSISVTDGLLPYIVGCEMTNFNEIVVSDHRRFMIDIDLNTYLCVGTSDFNKISIVILNLRRLIYKNKFVKKAEEMIVDLKLDQTIKTI